MIKKISQHGRAKDFFHLNKKDQLIWSEKEVGLGVLKLKIYKPNFGSPYQTRMTVYPAVEQLLTTIFHLLHRVKLLESSNPAGTF